VAVDRVRKKEYLFSPEVLEMERQLSEALHTRVAIEPKENGGKLAIDYSNEEDLRIILNQLATRLETTNRMEVETSIPPVANVEETSSLDDRSKDEIERDENTFDPSNFSL
jgi:hypothetical protein